MPNNYGTKFFDAMGLLVNFLNTWEPGGKGADGAGVVKPMRSAPTRALDVSQSSGPGEDWIRTQGLGTQSDGYENSPQQPANPWSIVGLLSGRFLLSFGFPPYTQLKGLQRLHRCPGVRSWRAG